MFLHLCVILFTGEGGLCPSMHHRSHDQGGLCPGGVSLSGGLCPRGVSVQGGSLSKGGISVQRGLCLGGLCPGGLCLRGVSVWGGSLFGGSLSGGSLSRGRVSVREIPRTETPRTVTSGRYASYWNAFLLKIIFCQQSQVDSKMILYSHRSAIIYLIPV